MVKTTLKKSFNVFGGDRILRLKNRTPRVLFWHGVAENPHPIIEAESISKKDFIQQINYLEKHYEIIPIEEFDKRYTSKSLKGKEVVLTFDDGYKNNLTVLAPIMRQRKLPFTVFITTKNITGANIFPTSIVRLIIFGSELKEISVPLIQRNFDLSTSIRKIEAAAHLSDFIKKSKFDVVERICAELIDNLSQEEFHKLLKKYPSLVPMNWHEVRQIKNYGGTIGSHCIDHICCHGNQEEEEILKQIRESKIIIENETDQSCDYFAFPNGDYTEFAQSCVSEAGYKLGFSTKKKKLTFEDIERTAIPRISMPYNIDTFKIMLNLYPRI